MKKFIAVFLVLGGAFFVSSQVFSATGDIIINEIGAYATPMHEWVEIYNKGNEQVDLTDWKFWEENTASQNHKITASTTDSIISPGEYGVIVQDAGQFILDYPNFSGSIFDSSFTLNESGEEIGLKDASGNFAEKFVYISAPNFSLQRRDANLVDYTSANWAQHASSNTAGAANVFENVSPIQTTAASPTSPAPQIGVAYASPQTILESPPQDLTPVKINEFMPGPATGNEWVELYNTGQTKLDLAGALICDSRNTTSTCKKIFGIVGLNEWLVVDLQTRSFLNNSGDSVILKDKGGNVIDRVDYEDELIPDDGQSLARKADGADTDSENDWVVAEEITAGEANTNNPLNSIILNASSIATSGINSSLSAEARIGAISSSQKKNKIVAKKISPAKAYKFVNSIEAARQASKGTKIVIKGVVSVLPGVFGSQYFYLTNGNAGIQVYQSKKDFPELAVGDLAQVRGVVSEANGIKRINIKSKNDLDILAVGRAATSTELSIDEIDESLAGGLAWIEGEITEIKSNFMYMDNGAGEIVVYFKRGAKIDKQRLREGENARITGILEQTRSGWQIWPRSNNDIELLGPSADLAAEQEAKAAAGATDKYFSATAGGVAALLLAFFARARGALLRRGAVALIGFIKKNKT